MSGCASTRNIPSQPGHDIDLTFRRRYLEKALDILNGVCALLDARLVHIHERDFVLALWITFRAASSALHLDFFQGGFAWHGLPFLADSTNHRWRRRLRDTWIARPSKRDEGRGGFVERSVSKANYRVFTIRQINLPPETFGEMLLQKRSK